MPPEQPSYSAGGDAAPSSAPRHGSQQPAPPRTSTTRVEIAAKSTKSADDSWLLAGLLLGFTAAVVAMVAVAGRRGGHRLR